LAPRRFPLSCEVIRKLFLETVEASESSARQYRLDHPGFDLRLLVLCLYVAFALSMIRYFGEFQFLLTTLSDVGLSALAGKLRALSSHSRNPALFSLAYWIAINVLFYIVLPSIMIKGWKQKWTDYGLSITNFRHDSRLYLWMFPVMALIVFGISISPAFQERYPFYNPAKGDPLFPFFLIWEVLYFVQFVGLEFFFRGFVVHGLRHRLGYYAVPVMTIPYCMIHWHKPMAETLAAIVAGLVLGTLTLRTRSIWWGVAIHYWVAVSMDFAALWRKGFF
jgi:membrane protease YdiL (CAAX protease family)